MKTKRRYVSQGGALILTACLAFGGATPVASAVEVDLDVVTKVVSAYQDLLDTHWTDVNCSFSSCVNASSSVFASSGDNGSQRGSSFGGSSKGRDSKKTTEKPQFTQAESAFLQVRDEMKKFGLPITSAKSSISVVNVKAETDGKVTVSANIGTEKTYQGDNAPSYMSDTHTLTLAPSKENIFAVIEDIINPVPVSTDQEDIPKGKELEESVPIEQLLKIGTGGDNRPVSSLSQNGATANFALLPAHQDKRPMGLQTVDQETKRQPKPDVQKMTDYALHWTSAEVNAGNKDPDKDVINPEYDNLEGTNCANFASQSLVAGGWKTTSGFVLANDDKSWSPKSIGKSVKRIPTHTWSAAQNLHDYALAHGSYHVVGKTDGLTDRGDLIFVDWDPNGKADGTIDHVMVVTGQKSFSEIRGLQGASPAITSKTPTISQKSPNRHDLPLVESMRLMNAAHGGKADMKWYPLANSKR